jgi:hypothetical protein
MSLDAPPPAETPVRFDPSPLKEVAVMIPVALIPAALIVTPDPTIADVAVKIPVLVFLLSSMTVVPETLIAIYRPRIHWVVFII